MRKNSTTSNKENLNMELNLIHRSMRLFSCFMVILSIGDSIQAEATKDECVIHDVSVETVFFDMEETSLQANISWEVAKPTGCSVDVRLVPLPSAHCSNKPCVWYGLNANITNVLLPRDPMPFIEHPECKVEPGCNYTVYVETADRSVQQIVKYELADCVGHLCSCKYSHLTPTITLNGSMDSKIFRIDWKLTGSTDDLQMYGIHMDHAFVSVGIQNNILLTWGGQYIHLQDFQQSFANENGKQQHFGFYLVDLNNVTVNGSYRLLIGANVFDSRGCQGNVTYFTYTVPSKASKSNVVHARINISLIIIMICTTSFLTLLGVSIVYACRHEQKRSKAAEMATYWRGFYLNEPSSGVRPSTISFQENAMYGEEILLTHHNQQDDGFFEIPHSSLKFSHNIGRGAFGSVYLAQAENVAGNGGTQIVAVKKLKKNSTIDELEEFFGEINMMKTVSQHPNIVSLIGYCTIKKPMLMVMEYVGCGDLLNYLRKLRHRHEVRSVVVSDDNNEKLRIPQVGSTHNLAKASDNSYDTSGYYCNASNNVNSTDTSTTNFSTNTITHPINHNFAPVGKYLELIHSPPNSSNSVTANSDASYVTRAGSETSQKRDTDLEINYAMFAQSNGMPTILPNTDCSFDSSELHSFAIQIARGMRHLEEKQITHRDLAARNILIDENKQLKISDFGLSRTGIYVNTKNKKVPLRWLAIEALRDHLYSTKSDVWSFGIVLWEIGTLGGMPYPSISNAALLNYLLAGKRMQRPEICSQQLYDLMRECWSENPGSRPFFKDIVERLERNTVQNPIYVNLDELELNYVFPPTVDDVLDKTNFGEFGETEINVFETATKPTPAPI